MASTTANGVELYFEVHGDGQPAVLGIHGTPSSAVLWEDAARELSSVCRCVIYDRRGFGRSGRPESFGAVDLATHVDDAAALLDALDAAPAVVIGRSTGGQIALALAQRRPASVRALVLLEPALFSIDPEAEAWARRLREAVLAAARHEPSSAAETVFRGALDDGSWEALPPELQRLLSAASPAVLAELRGHGFDLSADPLVLTAEELALVTQPTLLVSARDSPEVMRQVADRLAQALPRSESVRVPGGHLIYPADPAVLDFVRRVSAGTA